MSSIQPRKAKTCLVFNNWVFAFVAPLCFPLIAAAEENQTADLQPGAVVIVGKESTEILVGLKPVGTLNVGEVLKISLIHGEWLLAWEKQGWVHRDDIWTPAQAEQHFTKEIREKPTAESYYNRAVALIAARRFEDAISDIDLSLKLNSNNAAAYNNRGTARQELGELNLAIEDFSKAIELSKENALFYVNRSTAWAKKGDLDKALTDVNLALKLDPENPEALNSRGVSWFEKGDLEKALSDYNQALEIAPLFAAAYVNRAAILKRQGKFEYALKDYTDAIRVDPSSSEAKNDFAWFLVTCDEKKYRNPKKAVELAEQACQQTANKDWNMLDTLAVAYAESGNASKAVSVLEIAISVAPVSQREILKQKREKFSTNSSQSN